jgi:hypothetical protein
LQRFVPKNDDNSTPPPFLKAGPKTYRVQASSRERDQLLAPRPKQQQKLRDSRHASPSKRVCELVRTATIRVANHRHPLAATFDQPLSASIQKVDAF